MHLHIHRASFGIYIIIGWETHDTMSVSIISSILHQGHRVCLSLVNTWSILTGFLNLGSIEMGTQKLVLEQLLLNANYMSIFCVHIYVSFWQEIYGLYLIIKMILTEKKKKSENLENFECSNYQESGK